MQIIPSVGFLVFFCFLFLHSFRELSLQLTNHSAASSSNAGHHWDPILFILLRSWKLHTQKRHAGEVYWWENTISRHVVAFRIDWESFPGKTKSLMRHCWPLLEKAPHTPEYSGTKLITAWIKKKYFIFFTFFQCGVVKINYCIIYNVPYVSICVHIV